MRLETDDDFNRRAAIALRGVTMPPDSWSKRFAGDVAALISAGKKLTSHQQAALFKVVHQFRRQITDSLVLEYAAARAKQAD